MSSRATSAEATAHLQPASVCLGPSNCFGKLDATNTEMLCLKPCKHSVGFQGQGALLPKARLPPCSGLKGILLQAADSKSGKVPCRQWADSARKGKDWTFMSSW